MHDQQFQSSAMTSFSKAVIDIGSNSVRLVIYAGPMRAPIPIFNNKVFCGLGRLDANGNMPQSACDEALLTLKHFKRVLDYRGVTSVHGFATAAIRDANNGAVLLAQIQKLGLQVQVLSGKDEARAAALGVLSAMNWQADLHVGKPILVGDMGGGSLELSCISKTHPDAHFDIRDELSMSIGGLRLFEQFNGDVAVACIYVQKILSDISWLSKQQFDAFYLVGGSWRAIAKYVIAQQQTPFEIVHYTELDPDQLLVALHDLENMSGDELRETDMFKDRRIDIIPMAAMVLRHVIEKAHIQKIIFTAAGVREGVLFGELDPVAQAQNPFLERAKTYAMQYAGLSQIMPAQVALADRIMTQIFDVFQVQFDFTESGIARQHWQILREASIYLSNISYLAHPDFKGSFANEFVLHTPLLGISHQHRMVMSIILYQRYNGRAIDVTSPLIQKFVSPIDIEIAKATGLALRFVAQLVLNQQYLIDDEQSFTLSIGDELALEVPYADELYIDVETQKSFKRLAQFLGLPHAIRLKGEAD